MVIIIKNTTTTAKVFFDKKGTQTDVAPHDQVEISIPNEDLVYYEALKYSGFVVAINRDKSDEQYACEQYEKYQREERKRRELLEQSLKESAPITVEVVDEKKTDKEDVPAEEPIVQEDIVSEEAEQVIDDQPKEEVEEPTSIIDTLKADQCKSILYKLGVEFSVRSVEKLRNLVRENTTEDKIPELLKD